jgi:hypothetical protein
MIVTAVAILAADFTTNLARREFLRYSNMSAMRCTARFPRPRYNHKSRRVCDSV